MITTTSVLAFFAAAYPHCLDLGPAPAPPWEVVGGVSNERTVRLRDERGRSTWP